MTEFKSAALPETQLRYLPLSQVGDVSRLPTTVKILLEGVLRAALMATACAMLRVLQCVALSGFS